jgi:hypothetical protein
MWAGHLYRCETLTGPRAIPLSRTRTRTTLKSGSTPQTLPSNQPNTRWQWLSSYRSIVTGTRTEFVRRPRRSKEIFFALLTMVTNHFHVERLSHLFSSHNVCIPRSVRGSK